MKGAQQTRRNEMRMVREEATNGRCPMTQQVEANREKVEADKADKADKE